MVVQLHVPRDVKDSKKGLYKYIGDKRKTRENVGPLLNEMWDLITQDIKKAEVLNLASQECQVPDTRGEGWSKEDVPLFWKRVRLRNT